MDEKQALIIMQKDMSTGMFLNELGTVDVYAHMALLDGAFAYKNEDKLCVSLRLTTDKELADWQFDAVYDYYDEQPVLGICESITEVDDCHNPTWNAVFCLDKDAELAEIEEKLNGVLKLHFDELEDVFLVIADKEEEYKTKP